MATIALESKKKLIDIKETTFHSLSVAAARKGISLKKFIEGILDNTAEDYDDTEMYGYLLKTDPEGTEPLNPIEQVEFEKWLGV